MALHALDLGAGHGQAISQREDVQVRGAVLAQPCQRDAH
jgi:hypothetical protein